jgi:NADPH:quinone reductase-like Zn-dependent oxidoreductase
MSVPQTRTPPERFTGIGVTKVRDGFPLEGAEVAVPRPASDQVLIHVVCSSLNPLDYKLAELNFLGRTPPAILGFDLSGLVVARGSEVTGFEIGDQVAAMAETTGDGGWAVGGGGYALARDFLTVKKPASLSYTEAAVLPVCFISAFKALHGRVRPGDSVYIPGGAGGVGHLAVQIASRVLGAGCVISSGSKPETIALAASSGAQHVFDYKRDDIGAEIARLTHGKGVDLVFNATYSERSFADTAGMVAVGGTWVVLGVGPGKTTRLTETQSPVDAILAERGARSVNVNLLRYFTEKGALDAEAKSSLRLAMARAMEWTAAGLVKPHIGKTITSTVDEINLELMNMKTGRGALGKVAVIVDQTLASEPSHRSTAMD